MHIHGWKPYYQVPSDYLKKGHYNFFTQEGVCGWSIGDTEYDRDSEFSGSSVFDNGKPASFDDMIIHKSRNANLCKLFNIRLSVDKVGRKKWSFDDIHLRQNSFDDTKTTNTL